MDNNENGDLAKLLFTVAAQGITREQILADIQKLPASKRDLVLSLHHQGTTEYNLILGIRVVLKLPDDATTADLLEGIRLDREALTDEVLNSIQVGQSKLGRAFSVCKSVIARLAFLNNKWVCFIRRKIK